MLRPNQTIEGDNNQQALRDINNINNTNNFYTVGPTTEESEEDIGIVQEIFQFIISSSNNEIRTDRYLPTDLLKVKKKIKKNFRLAGICAEVENYYRNSLNYIQLIQTKFSEFSPIDQTNVHNYIYYHYNCNLNKNISNIENLRALFVQFIPKGKDKNPRYHNIAQSIVLFFFEDCTIFEKTIDEKKQTKLIE